VSDDGRYDGLLRMAANPSPRPATEPAGTLTPESVGRAMDEMWSAGTRVQLPCDSGCACCEPPAGPGEADAAARALMRELAGAGSEEEAAEIYLSALVRAGVITQAEADEIRVEVERGERP
jgi:hypothetical protein